MELALELQIPARPEYIAIVRLVVSSLASARRELADERLDDLKLAVSEACTNAIEAHAAAAHLGPIGVRVWEANERLEVHIEDQGGGFDPQALRAPPEVTDPDRLNFERGLGIPLMRSLVDDVRFFRSAGGAGTTVRLTIYGGPSGASSDETSEILRIVLTDDDAPA